MAGCEGSPSPEEGDNNPNNIPDVFNLPLEMRRVKLYQVDLDTGAWVDRGTGHLYVDRLSSSARLTVYSEADSESILIQMFVHENSEYWNQKESIITWQDSGNPDIHRALSFQTPKGCSAAWKFITENVPSSIAETSQGEEEEKPICEFFSLPTRANIEWNVEQLDYYLTDSFYAYHISVDACSEKFLRALFRVQNECIELNDITTLKQISYLLRKLVLHFHYNLEIFTTLLCDEFFLPFLRSCEYDPDVLNQATQLKHVNFFQTKVHYHDVLAGSAEWNKQVHFMYRVTYVRDVCLIRYMDEQILTRLNQMLMGCMLDVFHILTRDAGNYFDLLKLRLREDATALMFLRDLLSMTKSVQLTTSKERIALFNILKHNEILDEILPYLEGISPAAKRWNAIAHEANLETERYYENVSRTRDTNTRPNILETSRTPIAPAHCAAIEVLTLASDQNAMLLHNAIVNTSKNRDDQAPHYWLVLCDLLENTLDEGIQSQIKDLILKLVYYRDVSIVTADELGAYFYDHGVFAKLTSILFDFQEPPTNAQRLAMHHAKIEVISIIAACAREHRHRFKWRAYVDRLPARILLAAFKPRFSVSLAIAAIKFLRICVGLEDSHLINIMTHAKIMKPVIWILRFKIPRGGRRGGGSLLESVASDFLEASRRFPILFNFLMVDPITVQWLREQKSFNVGSSMCVYSAILSEMTMSSNNDAIISSNTDDRPFNSLMEHEHERVYLDEEEFPAEVIIGQEKMDLHTTVAEKMQESDAPRSLIEGYEIEDEEDDESIFEDKGSCSS